MLDRVRMLGVVAAMSWWACGPALAADPKVPPGHDPGGTAIALIGGGIDYTSEKIAPRLARDGEGELIGWDMIDNDRRPFPTAIASGGSSGAASKPQASSGKTSDDDTELASLILSAYAKGQLVPVRTRPGEAQALATAIAFVAGTPARIVVIAQPLDSAPLRLVVRQASERFKDHLFVVAGDVGLAAAPVAGGAPLPSLMNFANVLVVAALGDVKGRSVDDIIKTSDLVVMPRGGSMFAGIVEGGPPRNAREAVALAGASAACQWHGRTEPLRGSAVKAATLDAARPLPDLPSVRGLDPMCWYGGVRY